jgi:hypothetical protein
MNIDCQWIEKNLEALFSGTLSQEDQGRAQHHIESCGRCGREVAALRSIDPLVKKYFQGELDRVRRASPRTVAKGRLLALGSAAFIAVGLLLAVTLWTSPPNSPVPTIQPEHSDAAAHPGVVPSSESADGTSPQVERAKPAESAPSDTVQTPRVLPTPGSNAPEFLVSDPAGYSRTLDDYRGHVLVIGVVRAGETDATSNLERLYKAFGTNEKIRFLAVSIDRQPKPVNTTFPIAYNRGSKLFGASPGDFLLLNEAGSIQLRGSLIKDLDKLQKILQER